MDLGLSRPSDDEESDEPSPWPGLFHIGWIFFKDRQQPYHLRLLGSEENGDSIIPYFPLSHSPDSSIPFHGEKVGGSVSRRFFHWPPPLALQILSEEEVC